ncbi:MAG: hypothetical protein CVU56_17490 [Deltaproteobacteria bacterium HGW-Deltaproteobacteria-14]|nr:MAG: hypothetical protein CVU56_17490 [Deltaproteobacteria bacterium HGW-Deltaproteobacteria-14]
MCAPACSVATCEQPDGCGGTCAPCPREATCSDCPLALSVVEREGDDERVRLVTVALDFAPAAGAPLPGMADLRFASEGDVELVQVAVGEAIIAAHKDLAPDPETGRPFRVLSDGSIQILIMSTSSADRIREGRWLFLKFRLGAAHGVPAGPAVLRLGLVEREALFAPPPADAALWGASFGAPLVVWSDDVEVNHVP